MINTSYDLIILIKLYSQIHYNFLNTVRYIIIKKTIENMEINSSSEILLLISVKHHHSSVSEMK